MNAKLLGFFSGFPRREFPADIAARLQTALTGRESLVFISAWPADFARNDDDAAGMHGMFAQWGMPFAQYSVIDERTDASEAARVIRSADCIFLMGGNATEQFRLIRDTGIAQDIRQSSAVILGVSAGSCNMAVHALDIWESDEPYTGLCLADITVKAHVAPENAALLQKLAEISAAHNLPICAMEDDSAIFVEGQNVDSIGAIRLIRAGDTRPFSPNLLAK